MMFVSTGHVAEGREFAHDVQVDQRGFLPLTREQVVAMSRGGMETGAHTRSHFDCGSGDIHALHDEIVGSRRDLDEWLGTRTQFFAFPWGLPANMSEAAIAIASRTYSHLLSAFGGENPPVRGGTLRHLRRRSHPNSLWELELQLQSMLEMGETVTPAALAAARPEDAPEPAASAEGVTLGHPAPLRPV
jgi:hypothetical protein